MATNESSPSPSSSLSQRPELVALDGDVTAGKSKSDIMHTLHDAGIKFMHAYQKKNATQTKTRQAQWRDEHTQRHTRHDMPKHKRAPCRTHLQQRLGDFWTPWCAIQPNSWLGKQVFQHAAPVGRHILERIDRCLRRRNKLIAPCACAPPLKKSVAVSDPDAPVEGEDVAEQVDSVLCFSA